MIVKAPRWTGTGLRGVRRGLGQTIGPPDIGAVDPTTGIPVSSTVDTLQQQLASLSFSQLTSVLDPFLASGNIYTGTAATGTTAAAGSMSSLMPLALIAGGVLLVIALGARR